MNKDSIKWLIAGLAGSFFCMALMGAGIFFAVQFAIENAGGWDDYAEEKPSYGPDAWRERETKHNAEHAEERARLEASGLLERYTVVSLHGDTRERLYNDQNFDLVEERLNAQFAAANTPLLKLRYGKHIDHLGNLFYNDNPEALWTTLEAWVAHSPDSYLPYLVRGNFAVDYAWYFRGNTMGNRVTEAGWDGFHTYLELAKTDLEQAFEMNPQDPESPATMITVASALGLGSDVMESYYQKTIAIDPLHRDARMVKLNFVQPKWGGSWEELEAVIEEARSHMDEFPMMVKVIHYGEWYMSDRGTKYEGTWNSKDTQWMLYEAFHAQARLSPDDLFVQADLASHALDLQRFDESAKAFESIGERFPEGCRLGELPNYHKWRSIAYAEHAQEQNLRGTPREKGLMDMALDLAPEDPTVSGLYLGYLTRQQDDALVQAFHDNLKDPYFETGSWASPPNYDEMAGMAKAARSDDWGIFGTDEQPLLLAGAEELAGENAYVRLVIAEAHISNDEFDEARVHLEKARTLDPDYLPALHIMGWLAFHQERWQEGIDTANQFLESGPSPYLDEFADDAQEIIELCEENLDK